MRPVVENNGREKHGKAADDSAIDLEASFQGQGGKYFHLNGPAPETQ